jgi:hypothetical protein
MSVAFEQEALAIQASDVSGQKVVKVAGIAPDATIGELVQGLVPKMELPTADAEGRPLSYHVRLEREGRHLHATEIVADVLEPEDRIVLQPNIMAGAR